MATPVSRRIHKLKSEIKNNLTLKHVSIEYIQYLVHSCCKLNVTVWLRQCYGFENDFDGTVTVYLRRF